MLPSWRLARTNLSGKWSRTALIAGAVMLAAALIVAVSAAISSVQRSMETGLQRLLGAADARIIHQFSGRFDDEILETVRAWPEVKLVNPRLVTSITLIHADRREDEEGRLLRVTPSAVGVDFAVDATFRPLNIIDGRMPDSHDEILLDAITAEEMDAAVGDLLLVHRFGDPIELTVAGIYERERLIAAIQRPQIRIDQQMLGEASGHPNQLSSIAIKLRPDTDIREFVERRKDDLPEQLALEPAEMVRAGFDQRIEASRFGVLITSILTFMCAAFIIVTAMTTSVTERQREMALVRSLGGGRAQLFAAQLWTGLVLGALGAALGVALGIVLAWSLVEAYREFLPAGLHLHGGGIGLAVIGSLLAGLAGSIYPAWQASRVSPLEAMTQRANPTRWSGLAWCALLGLALLALQLVLMLPEDKDTRFFAYAYAGLPAVHLGYFVLAIPLVMIITLATGGALSRMLHLPRGMLSRSILSTPYRHGFTAGALMVGVSLLVSTWSGGRSLLDDWLGKIEFADAFVYHPTGIRPETQRAVADLPFVKAYCPISHMPVRVVGERVFGVEGIGPANVNCFGFDPEVFFAINAVEWIQGDPETAIPQLRSGEGILVAERFLTAHGIGVGETLTLGSGRVEREFEIVGVVGAAGLDVAIQFFGVRSAYMEVSISAVFMDFDRMAEIFDNREAYIMQLNLVDGVSDEEAREAIADVAPGLRFRSGRWIMDMVNRIAITLLSVQSVIAFCALFLACLGVGNVIAANVHARRYEYGVLRATGGSRSLLMRLILGEAGLLALAGAVTGTLLGLHLTWNATFFYRDLMGLEIRVTWPMIPAAIGWSVLLLMTLIAALPPAISIIRHRPSMLLALGRND